MKAVIFDFDGVIADSLHIHHESERNVMREFGVEFTFDEYVNEYTGKGIKEIFAKKLEGKKYDMDELVNKKVDETIRRAGEVKMIPGLRELTKLLKKHGYKMIVASAGQRRFIDVVLKKFGIMHDFEGLVTMNEVKRGKPNPDIFLLAAKKLGAKPSECVVIEDGVNGMEAARNAGMKCIGFVADVTKDYPCDLKVDSLNKIKIEDVEALIKNKY
ncbi:MAG: HAD family phosphatase [Nanoarchaeota archaeon]